VAVGSGSLPRNHSPTIRSALKYPRGRGGPAHLRTPPPDLATWVEHGCLKISVVTSSAGQNPLTTSGGDKSGRTRPPDNFPCPPLTTSRGAQQSSEFGACQEPHFGGRSLASRHPPSEDFLDSTPRRKCMTTPPGGCLKDFLPRAGVEYFEVQKCA